MSHVFLLDVPSYPRPLLITDAALNIYPSLDEKVDIVQNAIDLAQLLGIHTPNVALLSAAETVHSKIKATVDAAALSKMAERGQIHGAVVDGPLAFDSVSSNELAHQYLRVQAAFHDGARPPALAESHAFPGSIRAVDRRNDLEV